MSIGAGRYDHLCTLVLERAEDATGCIVMVLGPEPGFSVQVTEPRMLAFLPALLRSCADQIEEDIGRDIKRSTQ
jgi:hypothetical protein